MPKKTTSTTGGVVERAAKESKAPDPRVFRGDRIDPMLIYGFEDFVQGRHDELQSHPDFPNPRTVRNMDPAVIEEIEQTGEILEPIKLYWTENGECILADGKTRLTGLGRYLRRRHDLKGKITIPLQRVKGTDNEIRLLMLKYNLSDTRRPLTEAEVSRYLKRLDAQGVTEDEQLKVLDRTGRKGKIWLNHMKQILDANPVVVESYEEGLIDFTTAKMIAKADFAQQKEALEKVLDLKKEIPDAGEAAIRKAAGVKKPNRVTLGFDPTINYLIDNVYIPSRPLLLSAKEKERRYKAVVQKVEKFVKAEGMEKEYHEALQAEVAQNLFQTFMTFLRMQGAPLQEQIKLVEENMDDDQRAALAQVMASVGEGQVYSG